MSNVGPSQLDDLSLCSAMMRHYTIDILQPGDQLSITNVFNDKGSPSFAFDWAGAIMGRMMRGLGVGTCRVGWRLTLSVGVLLI